MREGSCADLVVRDNGRNSIRPSTSRRHAQIASWWLLRGQSPVATFRHYVRSRATLLRSHTKFVTSRGDSRTTFNDQADLAENEAAAKVSR